MAQTEASKANVLSHILTIGFSAVNKSFRPVFLALRIFLKSFNVNPIKMTSFSIILNPKILLMKNVIEKKTHQYASFL